ncbi:glycosyltransferase family 4 protein [Massilia horti]|uniref:Glycosyltransferase n=1 Tax=Massilia horti TaxID=2562153 RepID=A0A4Y9T639_9BURK|nr:glycosyltransferase family 4 protein [Massilia horti]TFW36316.1 glycosyltransferase [Massilia horti]
MKIALVTNGPAPYRIPALNRLAETPGISLHVIYCCKREPNREWNLPDSRYTSTYLRERIIRFRDTYIHNNPDVVKALRQAAPDVIITTGFNPTHLYAIGYGLYHGLPHVAMTDGTFDSEQCLSALHRWIRRFVYARSQAFIYASLGGKRLYASYGIPDERCFGACLCVDNSAYSSMPDQARPFDLLFCGRIEAVKNPFFALDVARRVAGRLGRPVSILFVGTGSLEQQLKQKALLYRDQVHASFNGFASQEQLPGLYQSARLFLFPSTFDPWGVVANEACAAGLPVLVSPHAGVAGELVLDGENGFVAELEPNLWTGHVLSLLTDPARYQQFSERSRQVVSRYTFDHASQGILTACLAAVSGEAAIRPA